MRCIIETDAYEIKPELGGGFRGVVRDLRSKTINKSPVMPDIHAAGKWAMEHAHKLWRDLPVTVGHTRSNRYRKNYFLTQGAP